MLLLSSVLRSAQKLATIAAFTVLPASLQAQEVTLVSHDRSASITGIFVSYDHGSYLLQTPIGYLRISASLVACTGLPCPSAATVRSDLLATGDIAARQKVSFTVRRPVIGPMTIRHVDTY